MEFRSTDYESHRKRAFQFELIADAPLDATDVGAIQFGLFRELILGKPLGFTLPEDVASEGMESTVARWSHARRQYAARLKPSVDDRLQCSKPEHRPAAQGQLVVCAHARAWLRPRT